MKLFFLYGLCIVWIFTYCQWARNGFHRDKQRFTVMTILEIPLHPALGPTSFRLYPTATTLLVIEWTELSPSRKHTVSACMLSLCSSANKTSHSFPFLNWSFVYCQPPFLPSILSFIWYIDLSWDESTAPCFWASGQFHPHPPTVFLTFCLWESFGGLHHFFSSLWLEVTSKSCASLAFWLLFADGSSSFYKMYQTRNRFCKMHHRIFQTTK